MAQAAANTKTDPLTPLLDRYFLERPYPASLDMLLKANRSVAHPHLRKGGRFTPSSMGECYRASVFQFMQVPGKRKTTPELEMIFAVGDWTHMMMYAVCVHMEQVLGPDTFRVIAIEGLTAAPVYLLAGWYDIKVQIRGRTYLMDFKTINDSGFTTLMHSRRPNPYHKLQLNRYQKAEKVRNGLLVYINKNDQRIKVFKVAYDKATWAESATWLRRAIRYLDNRELPPMHPQCTSGSKMQKDCSFAYMCYGKQTEIQLTRRTYEDKDPRALWEETTGRHL